VCDDLNEYAATLRSVEQHGSWSSFASGWTGRYRAADHIRAYLDSRIPGPQAIRSVDGSLGRALQHTLLRDVPHRRYPHLLEPWDLDWAAADPDDYYNDLMRYLPIGDPATEIEERRRTAITKRGAC